MLNLIIGPNVLEQNSDVVDYKFWKSMILARSIIFIFLLLVCELIVRSVPTILVFLFPSLKFEGNKFMSFDTPLFMRKTKKQDIKLLTCYLWTFRCSLLSFFLIIWEVILISNKLLQINNKFAFNKLHFHCKTGWSCYNVDLPAEITLDETLEAFKLWFNWNFTNVCQQVLEKPNAFYHTLMESQLNIKKNISCLQIFPSSGIEVIKGITIAFAFSLCLYVFFECLIAIQLRSSRRKIFNGRLLVLIAFILMFLITVVSFCIELLWDVTPSSNRSLFLLILLVIMYQSRCASKILRTLKAKNHNDTLNKLRNVSISNVLQKNKLKSSIEDEQQETCFQTKTKSM